MIWFCFIALFLVQISAVAIIDHDLQELWLQNASARANILLRMADQSRVLTERPTARQRWKRLQTIVHSLRFHATKSQKRLMETLAKYPTQHGRITQLWITNTLSVEHATKDLVTALIADPYVQRVSLDIGEKMTQSSASDYDKPVNGFWGMDKVNAVKAWKRLGHRGEGSIVGIIDTGINIKHESFNQSRLVGWKDASEEDDEYPHDDNTHGTHVAGKIVGLDGVGVAPGADFVVCSAYEKGTGTTERLLSICAQYMLCPDEPTCHSTPHVINNSWNLKIIDPTLTQAFVNAWSLENIIPVASAGNNFEAKSCDNLQVTAPGTFSNIITVGALTRKCKLAYFSRQGTENELNIKPDLVAPGHEISSAHGFVRDGYSLRDGTSLAAPFVTGAIALLIGEARKQGKELTFQHVFEILTKSASKKVRQPEISCEAKKMYRKYPSIGYGYGVLDINAAVKYFKRFEF